MPANCGERGDGSPRGNINEWNNSLCSMVLSSAYECIPLKNKERKSEKSEKVKRECFIFKANEEMVRKEFGEEGVAPIVHWLYRRGFCQCRR